MKGAAGWLGKEIKERLRDGRVLVDEGRELIQDARR